MKHTLTRPIASWLLFMLLLSSHSPLSAAESIRHFVPGSYADILAARQNKAFVLVFWSLDCPPCHQELAMLGDFIRHQPRLELVLISTDGELPPPDIQAALTQYKLHHIAAWVFSEGMAEQLRYEIDPGWYGELPRSYLFDAQHKRQAVSGVLSHASLQGWLGANP